MHTIVLRGDWEKLCRRGDRVWVRVRPQEIVWKTADDFSVADIRAISIEPVQLELKRKSRVPTRGDTRLVRHAITRVVIAYASDGEEHEVKMDVHEPDAVVIEAFADVRDRLAQADTDLDTETDGETDGAVVVIAAPVDIDLVAEQQADAELADEDELPYISWKPASEMLVACDPDTLVAVAANHDPELGREVSFKLELGAHPDAVARWLESRVKSESEADAFDASDGDLFGDGDVQPGTGWVLERRKRRLRHRFRVSGARTSR